VLNINSLNQGKIYCMSVFIYFTAFNHILSVTTILSSKEIAVIKFLCLCGFSADSPVLWLRMDKELQLLRSVTWQQPDYMWQYQLRYERDIIAQCQVNLQNCSVKSSCKAMVHGNSFETRCGIRWTLLLQGDELIYQQHIWIDVRCSNKWEKACSVTNYACVHSQIHTLIGWNEVECCDVT